MCRSRTWDLKWTGCSGYKFIADWTFGSCSVVLLELNSTVTNTHSSGALVLRTSSGYSIHVLLEHRGGQTRAQVAIFMHQYFCNCIPTCVQWSTLCYWCGVRSMVISGPHLCVHLVLISGIVDVLLWVQQYLCLIRGGAQEIFLCHRIQYPLQSKQLS